MKKFLLPVLLLFLAVYTASAQCNVGKSATYVFDNFTSATEPSGDEGGLYFDGGTAVSSSNRDAANGELDIVMTQGYGAWSPFSINFGVDEFDNPYTIDLSGDASYFVMVRNDDPTVTIKFRMAIQDVAGNQIDTDQQASGTIFTDAWKYTIDIAVPPGETKSLMAGVTNSAGDDNGISLTGTYANGYYAHWGPNVYEQDVDFTQIMRLYFFVTNDAQNASDGYAHYGFADLPLSILGVKVGGCALGISKGANNNDMRMAPNPANGLVKVSYAKTSSEVEVIVRDIIGNIVLTKAGSDTEADLYVGDLNKGIYFVTVVSNGTPVSSQKLVVSQ